MKEVKKPENRIYIGDGVYAELVRDRDDAIILTSSDGRNTIILGRDAWEDLVDFVEIGDLAKLVRAEKEEEAVKGKTKVIHYQIAPTTVGCTAKGKARNWPKTEERERVTCRRCQVWLEYQRPGYSG